MAPFGSMALMLLVLVFVIAFCTLIGRRIKEKEKQHR